jgi:hypothetical protein
VDSTPETGGAQAAWFTGTFIGSDGEPGEQSPGQDYTDIVGAVGRGEVQADDPRISGTFTQLGNIRLAGDIGVVVGTNRIENDQGAWVGTNTTYGGPLGHEEWYVLAGEGAYEGLTAVFRYRSEDNSFEGVIVPFELPAMPAAVAPTPATAPPSMSPVPPEPSATS